MHTIFLLLLTLISFSSFAQIKSTVVDAKTKKPIPYVNIWLDGENLTITADENGKFSANPEFDKFVIFSAVGYENLSLKASDIKTSVQMTPQIIQLNEVVINAPKSINSIRIGSLEDAENSYIGQREGFSWTYANYYPYKPEYENVPYFKTLKLITDSEVKGAVFNIRFYTTDANGEPGDYLYNQNILCEVKKGKRTNTIDLSQYNIRFPEGGVFIALESLTIEKNRYKTISRTRINADGKSENLKMKDWEIDYMYAPEFATTRNNKPFDRWIYIKGRWNKVKNETRLKAPALEILLTN